MKSCVGVASAAQHPLAGGEQDLVTELEALGIPAAQVVWDDPSIDWSTLRAVVIRSTWDYCDSPGNFERFLAWIDRLKAANVVLVNPASIVRWNLQKDVYLQHLRDRGASIVPTTVVADDTAPVDLREVMLANKWSVAVVKPAVSASSKSTELADLSDAASMSRSQELLTSLLRVKKTVLIQQFMPNIRTEGEISLVFFNDASTRSAQLSHALRKMPEQGDFRVAVAQTSVFKPTEAMMDAAERVLSAAEAYFRDNGLGSWTFARVDLIADDAANFCLMELELVEPFLWMSLVPGAAARFARAVGRICV